MKILVSVNHVPDTETKVKVAADGKSIDPAGVNFMLNPYDEYAVEEALRLREKFTGEVVVVSIGGEAHKEALRKSLAMGCDKAVLLKDASPRDSFGVARALADYAKEYSPDVFLCGKQSIDYDDAQVGGLVAEMLGIPSVSVVVKLDVAGNRRGDRGGCIDASGRYDGSEGAQPAPLSFAERNYGSEAEANRGANDRSRRSESRGHRYEEASRKSAGKNCRNGRIGCPGIGETAARGSKSYLTR